MKLHLPCLLALLLNAPVLAADPMAAGLVPGRDYVELPLARSARVDKPLIRYFFWPGCKHCARFEQDLPAWRERQGDAIQFERIPAVFRPAWRLHALGYYAAEQLGQGDVFLDSLYQALLDQGHELKTREELVAYAAAQGLDRAAFLEALDLPEVKARVLAAERLQKQYSLPGVPALVINERYMTHGKLAGRVGELYRITEILAELPVTTAPPETASPSAVATLGQ